MTSPMTADERRDALTELLFMSPGDLPWDYTPCLGELLTDALAHVEGLIGPELSAAPLRQLVDPIAQIAHPDDETWRDVMDNHIQLADALPISLCLNHAALYGHFGVTPAAVLLADRAGWLADLVRDVTRFAARSDVQALDAGDNAITRIAALAAARHALDTGRGEVDIRSMSVLGGITEGRVRNLLSGSEATLERGPQGGVVALSALAWLTKKRDYLASIWQEQAPLEAPMPEEAPAPAPGRMLFVPVARDGSIFSPDLLRNGSYRIGAKGEEEDITAFEAALERLNAMPVPRWRRPNEKGLWGIVSGVAWQRIEKP